MISDIRSAPEQIENGKHQKYENVEIYRWEMKKCRER